MVEQVRTQLFMMLVQQAGSGALPLSNLTPAMFLPFMRRVEENVLEYKLSPLIVYWSTHDVQWLLPEGQEKSRLIREALVSTFGEDRSEKKDEFCFLVQSQGISVVIYGHRTDDTGENLVYQCVGSLDPHIVKRAFQVMMPLLQFIDLPEANRIDDARARIGIPVTAPHFVHSIRNEWPVVKQKATAQVEVPVPTVGGETPGRKAAREILLGSQGTSSLRDPQMVIRPGADVTLPPLPRNSQELLKPGHRDSGFDFSDVAQSEAFRPPQPQEGRNGDIKPGERKRDVRGMRELREVWTNITQEVRSIFAPDAQRIIRDIVSQLRHSSDLDAILQLAIKELTLLSRADRGLIWLIEDDRLIVKNEFATSGHNCFSGRDLRAEESRAIVGEFLSRFPDESGSGVIAIPDSIQDSALRRLSPTLADLIELGSVRARLVAQIRCRGIFHGFLELQQTDSTRDWSDQDGAVLQSVSETLSLVVQQSFDLQRIERDAEQMKLVNEIAAVFRESGGQYGQKTIELSVKKIAEHVKFAQYQVYLVNELDELVPQIPNQEYCDNIQLSNKLNPFVQVFELGRLKTFNLEVNPKRPDLFFGLDTALVIPVMCEGAKLGVLGLWKRTEVNRAIDSDLAMTVVSSLASYIRAENALQQERKDQIRASLINRVSKEIDQSLKEVDRILDTMVGALTEYFQLALCVVSIYDSATGGFGASKVAGDRIPDEEMRSLVGEQLFIHFFEYLGQIPILSRDEVREALKESAVTVPDSVTQTILCPLTQGAALKGGLCLMFTNRDKHPTLKDMHMVEDLLNRVAVVLSHKELFEQVERQAVTDPMTGLYNRRYFQEQLSKELDRHQRFGHPFSYIIVDLDYLKKINDTLGHQYGDDAIKHISQVIKKCVRDVDTTARFGGEEFVVLLPETEAEGAHIVAERMCASIREREVEGVGVVTASIGVATFPTDTDDRDKLSELADQALYLAKHRGRNQVCTVSRDLLPSLQERSEEAFEVQKEVLKKKTEQLSGIDIKLIAQHGILGLLSTVVKMIEERDAYSSERSTRVAEYAQKIAMSLRLSRENTTIISLAAILNNLGKIGIDEKVLQKKGPLTDEERKLVESSPSMAARILEPAKHLHRVASVVESYHEHWDGTGYPRGTKGEEIPLESRIIALVDAFVAMTSDRPYRRALTQEQAIKELLDGSGKEWDPRLVKLFVAILQKDLGKPRG